MEIYYIRTDNEKAAFTVKPSKWLLYVEYEGKHYSFPGWIEETGVDSFIEFLKSMTAKHFIDGLLGSDPIKGKDSENLKGLFCLFQEHLKISKTA